MMGDRHLSEKGEFLRTQSHVDRPIHKLAHILSAGDLNWETKEIHNEEPIWQEIQCLNILNLLNILM